MAKFRKYAKGAIIAVPAPHNGKGTVLAVVDSVRKDKTYGIRYLSGKLAGFFGCVRWCDVRKNRTSSRKKYGFGKGTVVGSL